MKTIALLATGVELMQGDILNTNGQVMAAQLSDAGLQVGNHVITSDDQHDMARAMRFLLAHHDVLVITGGLGPTSDDRTRFALAEVLGCELQLYEPTWARIQARAAQYNFTLHESNQQQALFPEDATVLVNDNGTADACKVIHEGKPIYMLPGPPRECMPIFSRVVLPELREHITDKQPAWIHFQLLGAVESEMANQLDALVAEDALQTGFRASFPYVQFKLQPKPDCDVARVIDKVNAAVAKYRVSRDHLKASEQCRQDIVDAKRRIAIVDEATGGQLQSRLLTPSTGPYLRFVDTHASTSDEMQVRVSGLEAYWAGNNPEGTISLSIEVKGAGIETSETTQLPFRNEKTLLHAVEWLSYQIDVVIEKYL